MVRLAFATVDLMDFIEIVQNVIEYLRQKLTPNYFTVVTLAQKVHFANYTANYFKSGQKWLENNPLTTFAWI